MNKKLLVDFHTFYRIFAIAGCVMIGYANGEGNFLFLILNIINGKYGEHRQECENVMRAQWWLDLNALEMRVIINEAVNHSKDI